MSRSEVRTVVLAAGRASRMGFDKLTAPFAGVPLARRLALALAELDPLVVTTPAVAEVLHGIPGVRVVMTLPTAGPSATLHLANLEIRPDYGLAVVAADLPFLEARQVRAFLERVPEDADLAWPVVDGVPGHPVFWSPNARARIPGLSAEDQPNALRRDTALRALAIETHEAAHVEDVDTPDAWRAAEERAMRSTRRA